MSTSYCGAGVRHAARFTNTSPFYRRLCKRARPILGTVVLVASLWGPREAFAQIQFLQEAEPQRVFGGEERSLLVTIYNPGQAPFEADVHARLYVANSTKAVPLGDTFWKHLQVLPGQTLHESVSLRFPPVKTETRFWLQLTDGGTRMLHMTEVFVHPPDLLKDLKPLLGTDPVGLYDPLMQLKPVLKTAGIDFLDMEKNSFEDYHGKLVICGPFALKPRMRGDLPGKIKSLAESGVAVVWFLPPSDKPQELQPSFYTVPYEKAAVVVAQSALVANLAESPAAQLHLLRFARLALHPEPPKLPYLSPAP